MIYFILFLYLGFTFWASLFGRRLKNDTPEAYFLAGRNLGTIPLFFTILATNFSAFYFLGFAGEGYRIGYSVYVIMALGTALASAAFFMLGPRIWTLGKRKNYITPSELIYGETNSRSLGYIFSAVMIVFTLPYLALQIVGGGLILEQLTDGQVSYNIGIVALSIVTIVYVLIGGMQSVAKTDLKQGVLMIFFMLLGVFLVGYSLGGMQVANETAISIVPDAFTVEGVNDHYSPQKWFSFLFFWIFCVPMFPQLFMRFYVSKDIKTLNNSILMYSVMPLFISILPVMIGVWGHISFPELVGKEADQILPMMLSQHAGELFSSLVMVGAIAAFMSTLDSQLLALGTMVTRDFYLPISKKKLSLKKEVRVGRLAVCAFAMIGLAIAFNPFDTIFDMGKMAFTGLAVLFPIAYAAVKGHQLNPGISVVGIFLSLAIMLAFYYKIIPAKYSFGFEYFVVVIASSFLFTILSNIGSRFLTSS